MPFSGQNRKPRVSAKSGWYVEGGELVFYPLPDTPKFTAKERRRLCRGHLRLQPNAMEVDDDVVDLDIDLGLGRHPDHRQARGRAA